MCGHCGCHGVDAVRELEQEHEALLDQAHGVHRSLARGEHGDAGRLLRHLVADLARHVRREEEGIFAAMREQGEFAVEVEALEGEHLALDAALAALDPAAPDFGARVLGILRELAEHIEREDLGIFPVSVVSLGRAGWATVDRAHAEHPSFLADAGRASAVGR
jgi:hemerythrin-like domain-containing protein